jgi:hypothetical protein
MQPAAPDPDDLFDLPEAPFELWVTLDYPDGSIELEWVRAETGIPEETMRVRLSSPDEISWEWANTAQMPWKCRVHSQAVRGRLGLLRSMYRAGNAVLPGIIPALDAGPKTIPGEWRAIDLPPGIPPWRWLEQEIMGMARQLRPQFSPLAKTLVPAIMAGVLATSSAKAATAGGGAAGWGALAKLSPFKWLVPFGAAVIGVLPSMAFSAMAARAEQRNFRDPEDFRAKARKRMNRIILLLVPLIVIPMVIGILALTRKVGQLRADWILAVVMVACLAWAWRMLGVRSRFQRGMVIWYGILAGGRVLKAAGLVSESAYPWIFIASCLWLMWIMRWQPTRMDNSLFFRAVMGMLGTPPPATSSTMLPTRLEKADLKRFGKFLTDRHLINAFRWRPEGLLLRQTFTKLP